MKYEQPSMELMEMDETDIVCLSGLNGENRGDNDDGTWS